MNQLVERMCSISNCCVTSRDREREQAPLFERRCAPATPVRPRPPRCLTCAQPPPRPARPVAARARRLREKNRRGVGDAAHGDSDGRGSIYADYDFDSSVQSQVCRALVRACVRACVPVRARLGRAGPRPAEAGPA